MAKISRRNFLQSSAVGLAGLSLFGPDLTRVLASARRQFAHVSDMPRLQSELNVAHIAQQMSAQSDQRTLKGWEDWLAAAGLSWNVTVSNAEGSPETLSAMIEDAVSREVDAIVVTFGTLTAAQGALQSVAAAGIPLITVDSGYYPPALCDIASNNYTMGAQMSSYMVQSLLGQGKTEPNIVTITANFHHGTRKRGKVRDAVLSENENIQVLGDQVIQYDGFFETTLNTVNDWLNRFGGDIDAVWCPWDEPAMAASQALLSQGMTVNDVIVVAADGHPPAVELMHDADYPMVATCAQAFELWGALAASFIDEIVGKGRPGTEVVPVPQIDFPAPFLVKGVNLPEAGKMPWDTVDFYTQFMNQARGQVGS
ncbi:MAG: sugar ABC transporter substrate-binding protein [Anaerolineae bacterium]|nr:sugar ABC transporter substrate-binding protein [Anaerolineae bacterium]